MNKPAHIRNYSGYNWDKVQKEIERQDIFLSGLFTSKYGDEFFLHYLCPLCNEQINVLKKLGLKSSEITIDYQREVGGRMLNQLREELANHFATACGTTPARRKGMAEILISKQMHEVYR